MSTPNPCGRVFFEGEWGRLEQVVGHFEEAWQRGERPAIDAYLSAGDVEPRKLIVELAHADLECRLKAGEAARAEAYFGRYAALADDRAEALRLIETEYRLRLRREPGLGLAEYLHRFPQYHQDLTQLFRGQPLPTQVNAPDGHPSPARGAAGKERSGSSSRNGCRPDVGPPTPSTPDGPLQLGPFELLEATGQGAFGTVYRARDVELGRIVAVKVPRLEQSVTPADVDRFVREARSAAGLSHPGIVPVYDVGRAEAVPYIVSAYVEGTTLADALSRRRFDFRETAQIVAQVAEALDYAHRNGVVHRDLKPSNIMLGQIQGAETKAGGPAVPGEGSAGGSGDGGNGAAAELQAFVMDFGLARRDEEEAEARLTFEGQVLGTPAYMSPEQARGQAHQVDGRSDVYSLGVILYELLTGELPFRGVTRMVVHQILHEEPRPPRRLNDQIPRDLETITLKCLAKEPGRRYATAAALAADLRRHLHGEPVLARPVGLPERCWRWAKRNPRVAGLSAAVLLLLVTVAVVSVIATALIEQKRKLAEDSAKDAQLAQRQAEERHELALDIFHELVYEVEQFRGSDRAWLQFKENLLTAVKRLERLPRGPRDDQRLASAHQHLGDILLALGQTDKAREHYERFRAITATLAAADPHGTWNRRALCVATAKLGDVALRAGDKATARAYCGQALELGQELAANGPKGAEAARDLALCYNLIGKANLQLGDVQGAVECYRKALDRREELAAADPDDPLLRRELAVAYGNVGDISEQLGEAEVARGYYRKALDRFEGLAVANPKDARARHGVAVAYLKLGGVTLRLGEAEAARAYRRKAQTCFEKLAAADPEDVQAQADLAAAYGTLGRAEMQARAYAEAAGYFKRGVAVLRQLEAWGKLKDQPVYQKWLRIQQHELSVCEADGRAIDDLDFALGQPVARAQELLVIRASALAARGRHADAAATAEKLRELAPADCITLYNVARCYALCVSGVAPGKAPDQLSAAEAGARRRYTTRALANLAEAVRRGYTDVGRMESDLDLAAVRSEREYQQAVERLRAATRPPRPGP